VTTLLWIALLTVGLLLVAIAAFSLARRAREGRAGALVAIDAGRSMSWTLRSERYRLVGRLDLVRRRPDGRPVPIEVKSRASFRDGPPRSHIIQLWAYCLLLEENERKSPLYGILRYGDGVEYTVPWGREERRILLDLREEMAGRYDGRARPAARRCAHCRWWAVCDARA
jgi:CRISPR-associated exonuclease Cas4